MRRELINTVSSSEPVQDGYSRSWSLKDLPTTLNVTVEVASNERIEVTIRSADELVYAKSAWTFNDEFSTTGPSLSIVVFNPAQLGMGPSALVTGSIRIYRTYEEPLVEWTFWWLP
jgi:hypothetical protein